MSYPEKRRRKSRYTLIQYQYAWEIVDRYYRGADRAVKRLSELPKKDRPDWVSQMIRRWKAVRSGLKWIKRNIEREGQKYGRQPGSGAEPLDTILPCGRSEDNNADR